MVTGAKYFTWDNRHGVAAAAVAPWGPPPGPGTCHLNHGNRTPELVGPEGGGRDAASQGFRMFRAVRILRDLRVLKLKNYGIVRMILTMLVFMMLQMYALVNPCCGFMGVPYKRCSPNLILSGYH